jgi:hypothetical protein
MSSTDFPGNRAAYKLLQSSTSHGGDTLEFHGGQGVVFELKNLNFVGCMYTVESRNGFVQREGSILLPHLITYYHFSIFGDEPIWWSFYTDTVSDACLVLVKIWSTWIPPGPT